MIEQRINELKAELNAKGFCMKSFLAVLFTFNLLSLYQKAIQPQALYRQSATLRAAVFLGGAILGRAGHKVVLHISAAWGGLDKHKPLLEAILRSLNVAEVGSILPVRRNRLCNLNRISNPNFGVQDNLLMLCLFFIVVLRFHRKTLFNTYPVFRGRITSQAAAG
ncbi:MAG: hypothetical protein WCO68_08685 [Verrucomicrobiota bacterium]